MTETTKCALNREECLEKAARAQSTNMAEFWDLRAAGVPAGEALRRVRGEGVEG